MVWNEGEEMRERRKREEVESERNRKSKVGTDKQLPPQECSQDD